MIDARSDEDRIIDSIIVEGTSRLFDDTDFLPVRQSLYTNANEVPEYDGDIFHRITWCRPSALNDHPVLFNLFGSTDSRIECTRGSLLDENFIGTLMAVASHLGRDLIEYIIASKPEDFKKYGIFTCRFYVEGQWVDVVTDTNLPCVRDETTGACSLVYSGSISSAEMWVAFIEKAYAKAVGSYEAIQKVRIPEALLHLTGGSVQQIPLRDKHHKEFIELKHVYTHFNDMLNSDTLVLLQPISKVKDSKVASVTSATTLATPSNDDSLENVYEDSQPGDSEEAYQPNPSNSEPTIAACEIKSTSDDMFHSKRVYSLVACREISGHQLFLLHNPWGDENGWSGPWGNSSVEWTKHEDIFEQLETDLSLPWTRREPNGYFWFPANLLLNYFESMYTCKLFPTEKFNFYCMKDEWKGKSAGGSINTIRDSADVLKDYALSRNLPQHKTFPALYVDGDQSWFLNPQFRVTTSAIATIYISLLPTSGSDEDLTHVMQITVIATSATSLMSAQNHIWEPCAQEIASASRVDSRCRIKGGEASVWSLQVHPSKSYNIVPHCTRAGLEGAFILRIFSTAPISIEKVPQMASQRTHGAWTKAGDIDTTGGPLNIRRDDVIKANPKWCQNPQYHLETVNSYSKEDLYLKIQLHRSDPNRDNTTLKKNSSIGAFKASKASSNDSKSEGTVGLVVCRADCLEELKIEAIRQKHCPRENFLGEIIESKKSTLKKNHRPVSPLREISTANRDTANTMQSSTEALRPELKEIRTIVRKTNVDKDTYYVVTNAINKSDSTVFFPKIPRSWIPHGLMIIPFMSEKNTKAGFELEVFASEPIKLTHMPDSYSRCVAGEWRESQAGGSHLLPSWKKNPKYSLKIRNSSYGASSNVRITLERFGSKWKSMCKNDAIGSMIGLYIFKTNSKSGETTQIYDTGFVPTEEVATESLLQLGTLEADEVYTVIPTTYTEGYGLTLITSESKYNREPEWPIRKINGTGVQIALISSKSKVSSASM